MASLELLLRLRVLPYVARKRVGRRLGEKDDEESVMSLEHAVSGNAVTEWGVRDRREERGESAQRSVIEAEYGLENRLGNLERLAESVHAALGRESFSGRPHALDQASDLRLKIRASRKMFRVAKLLSEPARGSMMAQVLETVDELEDVVAAKFGVEMT